MYNTPQFVRGRGFRSIISYSNVRTFSSSRVACRMLNRYGVDGRKRVHDPSVVTEKVPPPKKRKTSLSVFEKLSFEIKSPRLENLELLIGDTLSLIAFCTYKQISAIALSPSFPGWLAPLHFSPNRFLEFFSFTVTMLGTWISAALFVGAYKSDAASSVPTALSRVSRAWIAGMPIAASQLVLLTAAEDGRLVGEEGWAELLPLAASGPGEPFVTAAGVLGLLAVWRSFYAIFLDVSCFLSIDGARYSREEDERHFWYAIKCASVLGLSSCIILHSLSYLYGESMRW